MKKTIHTLLFICSTWIGAVAQISPYLDQSFGVNGRFTHDFAPKNSSRLWCTAPQSDGKIVAGGMTYINGYFRAAALRCFPDGTLDTTFATHGEWISEDEFFDIATKIIVQPDDKILLSGRSYGGLKVVRLLPNGSYDTSFGVGGIASVAAWPATQGAYVSGMELLPDGRIIILGNRNDSYDDCVIVRLSKTGNVEGNFGSFGFARLHKSLFNGTQVAGDALKVLPDNTILVTGETIIGGTYAYFLVRYKFNGQLDLDFGNNGVRYISYLTTVSVVRIWTLPDASLLMLGVCRDSQYKFHSGLIKLKPDGVIDSTFAVNGIGFLSHNNLNSGPNRGALQPDGKVVVFGGSTNGIGFLGRFNADGSPDLTFGANGTLSPESTYEIFYDGFVQPDGNIVTVSRYQSPQTQLCSILRYLGSHSVGALETPASLGAALIFPNPVSGGVFQVAFELPEAAPVQIELLDLQGRLLGRLLSANRPSGLCEETLVLPAGIAPGYYLVNIQSSRGNRVVRIAVP